MLGEIIGGIIVIFITLLLVAILVLFAAPGLLVFFYNGPPLSKVQPKRKPTHKYDEDEDVDIYG
jgi:hypothetical protein